MRRLILALTLITLPLGLLAANEPTFDGVPGHPYEEAMQAFRTDGILQGYADGQFRPEQVVNRAEFLKIVLLAADIDPGGESCFPDVGTEWFAPWVCAGSKAGIVAGYPDGQFRPGRTITFAEAAKMLARAFGGEPAQTDPWYRGPVEWLAERGAIPPSITGFDHLVTRAETAAAAWILRGGEESYGRTELMDLSLDYSTVEKLSASVGEHRLAFARSGRTVVLTGSRVSWLCTPSFRNADEEAAAWVDADADSFYARHCPDAEASAFGYPDYFPSIAAEDALIRLNPGGQEELRIVTDADIKRFQDERIRPKTVDDGTTTWTECRTDTRMLAEGVAASTLACTMHYQTEEMPEASFLLPNTHCFVPLGDGLHLGYLIPVSAMDAAGDGCRQLKWWGVRSIRLE